MLCDPHNKVRHARSLRYSNVGRAPELFGPVCVCVLLNCSDNTVFVVAWLPLHARGRCARAHTQSKWAERRKVCGKRLGRPSSSSLGVVIAGPSSAYGGGRVT